MNDQQKRILATIKNVVDTLSPNGETYTPEELAQAFAEKIIKLEDLFDNYEANDAKWHSQHRELYARAKDFLANQNQK